MGQKLIALRAYIAALISGYLKKCCVGAMITIIFQNSNNASSLMVSFSRANAALKEILKIIGH